MARYVFLVWGLSFLVDLLLILGTNRLLGCPPGWVRTVLAAMVDGVFSALCLCNGFGFLKGGIWRLVTLLTVLPVAFGMERGCVRRYAVFLLLKFAAHGAAGLLDGGSVITAVIAGIATALLCVWGLPEGEVTNQYIPVELHYGNRRWNLTALRDTGNTLRDPLTGERVLVAGADMGQKLFGLTAGQLSDPARTLAAGQAPGMRLIPYRTVGQPNAMMLALRMKDVRVGSWKGSAIVAFAPECFGNGNGYQMLIGGNAG